MRRWPLSVRARLTTWYVIVLGVPLIAYAVMSYVGVGRTLLSRTDHFLDEALSVFATELSHEVLEMPTGEIGIRVALAEMQFREMQILMFDSASHFVAAGIRLRTGGDTASLQPEPIDVRQLGDSLLKYAAPRARFTFGHGRNSYRVHVQLDSVIGVPYRIVGAYPLASISDTLADLWWIDLVAIPLLLLSAAVGGYILVQRSLAPVSAMRTRAREISATNLHERLPVATPHDELGGLASVINGLLSRLEDAFVHQRRFMADASHELRTPVAILRAEVDVALSREHRDEQEYRDALAVMSGAVTRLARIVDDLFLLTRADSGHLTVRREPLYLEEIVHEAARAVRGLAERRGLRLELTEVDGAPFEGDADLLGRLLLNLLDNAIKYSERGGVVELGLVARAGLYEITVRDEGPGIPAELRGRIFLRFVRADAARSRTESSATSGAGLGLAIARWVAEAHGGSLDLVESRPGRTEFRVRLPHDGSAMSSAMADEDS